MKDSVIAMSQGGSSDDRINVFADTKLFKPEKSTHAKKVIGGSKISPVGDLRSGRCIRT